MDEYEIAKLKSAGACCDGYGVGTRLVTGKPVNGVYKLVEINGIATLKQATNKTTYPGRKQIYRQVIGGKFIKDRLTLVSESPLENEQPLLQLVMKQGQRLHSPELLEEIQKRTLNSVASLATSTRQLNDPTPLPVEISDALQQLTLATQQRQKQGSILKRVNYSGLLR